MARLLSIISKNNATFYNYRDGKRFPIWPRIAIVSMISPLLAFLFNNNIGSFIDSLITVFSILLGFAFSVLFYISTNKETTHSHLDISLEHKNRVARVSELSRELFHNVSYFVVVASTALAMALIVTAPEFHGDWFAREALPILMMADENAATYVGWISLFIRSVFFFLVMEAAYTFARIVGRVNFFFEEKLGR